MRLDRGRADEGLQAATARFPEHSPTLDDGDPRPFFGFSATSLRTVPDAWKRRGTDDPHGVAANYNQVVAGPGIGL